jgi:putative DNA primase/helicase
MMLHPAQNACELAAALGGARKSGRGWQARCPCHDDRNASLSINQTPEGKILVKCHAGCEQGLVFAELKTRGLLPQTNRKPRKMGAPRETRRASGSKSANREPETEEPLPWRPPPDAEPPEEAAARLSGRGELAATWRYCDEQGRLLFAVARYNRTDGDKNFLPFTWRNGKWCCKGWNEPRPLYCLDKLALDPEALVLVCEGEKAADAAQRLIPGAVTITSCNGAKAPDKSDWTPLAGRRVLIWPDHDAPGAKYARAVAAILETLDCEIAIVDVESVGRALDRETLPAGWDAADAVEDFRDRFEILRAVVLASARPYEANGGHEAELEDGATLSDVEFNARIAELAVLSHPTYAQRRREEAKKLGLTAANLDVLVAEIKRSDDAEETEKPRLQLDHVNPDRTLAAMRRVLAASGGLYDRGVLVRVAFDRMSAERIAEQITAEALIEHVHKVSRPYVVKIRQGDQIECEARLPRDFATMYLDARGDWDLPPLSGIISAPILREDGEILCFNGYDPGTGLWCEGVPALVVPELPSEKEAAAALMRLRVRLQTFCFADSPTIIRDGVAMIDVTKPPGLDESVSLAALLTAACRSSLWLAPGLIVRGAQHSGSGAGKGKLVRCISAIALGRQPHAVTRGKTPDETEKRITTELIEARPVVFLDNINNVAAFASESLASAMSERPARVRVFGKLKTAPINATAFVAVTGNGVGLAEDLARRFLLLEFDPGVEDPELRQFKGDILGEIQNQRGSLLSDALTIWRWGRQNSGLKLGLPFGNYEQWARWVRDPLNALGCQDVVRRVAEAKQRDVKRQHIVEIFRLWDSRHGRDPVSADKLDPDVKKLVDPQERGRQYLAAHVQLLAGVRLGGFMLLRQSSGRWNPATYALVETRNLSQGEAEGHGVHRVHKEESSESPTHEPCEPYGMGENPRTKNLRDNDSYLDEFAKNDSDASATWREGLI